MKIKIGYNHVSFGTLRYRYLLSTLSRCRKSMIEMSNNCHIKRKSSERRLITIRSDEIVYSWYRNCKDKCQNQFARCSNVVSRSQSKIKLCRPLNLHTRRTFFDCFWKKKERRREIGKRLAAERAKKVAASGCQALTG